MKKLDNLDKINKAEKYYGEVVDVDTTHKQLRIKVKVKTVFDDIPTEYIPWAVPKYIDSNAYDLPFIGELVFVTFIDNDIYFPEWFRRHNTESITEVPDEDYSSSSIVFEKDLSQFDLDGHLSINYTETNGLRIELQRNDNKSNITISNDNTVYIENKDSGQVLHVAEDNISIGSMDRSQQPGVVGDDNKQALDFLNEMVNDLFDLNKTLLDLVSAAASASPYTKHLSIPIKTVAQQLKTLSELRYNNNKTFFPETLSQVVTIDKTNEK